MDEMSITTENNNEILVVHVSGIIDAESNMKFGQFFKENAIAPKMKMILDLKQISYINSMGIGTIVSSVKRIRANNGEIAFLQLSDEVAHVFDLTGLSELFEFFDSMDAAVNFLSTK